MKTNVNIILLIFFSSILMGQKTPEIYYVELIGDQEITNNPIKQFRSANIAKAEKRITLYPELEFQTMEGIGGAFNEIGGEALMSLPAELQEEIMQSLFSSEGANFSFCRTAIGASDFGIDAYSYSESPEDYSMKHFSVEREKKTVLPYITSALKYNSNLKVFASPWSPPGWMKSSGLMDRGIEFPEKNHLRDDPEIYSAYALYFIEYIKAYRKEGIEIDRLIIQNEPDVHTKYPSCVMPPQQMGMFARDYLKPVFTKHKLNTEIWAGTFRTAQQLDALAFVADSKFNSVVDGIGIQYTKPRFIFDMVQLMPEVNYMHTEGNCFNGQNTADQAKTRLAEIASYINHGVPNYCYWNMILNETGKSGWDWKQNSLINIDREKKSVTYNPDFLVLSLVGKYLKPGTKRIAGFARTTLISVADDSNIFLFLQNDKSEAESYQCWINDEVVSSFEIPANALSVVILNK